MVAMTATVYKGDADGRPLTVYYTAGEDHEQHDGDEWESIRGVFFRLLGDGRGVDAELGLGGADAGERDVADAVAGDDSVRRRFRLHRSGLYDAVSDRQSSNQIRKVRWTYSADLQAGTLRAQRV